MKYKCKKCGTEFDARFDVVCPKCHSTETEVIYTYHYPKSTEPVPPIESRELA
jgi:NMD protein affecting ribosome stability and mRNA decay